MKQVKELEKQDKQWQKRKARDSKEYEAMLLEYVNMQLEKELEQNND